MADNLAPSDATPVAITRDPDNSIRIRWNDDQETVWSCRQLRLACPCATCREKKRADQQVTSKPKGLPVISAAEARPLKVESMRPAGNYGYHITFSDGHNSGIFTFAMLRSGEGQQNTE